MESAIAIRFRRTLAVFFAYGKDPVFLNQIEGLALHKYEKEIVN